MSRFLTLDDLDVRNMRVLLRSDLNVPLNDRTVADDFRIRAAIPTIQRLRDEGAVVIVCSHLGRPKGAVVDELRLAPVAKAMSAIGGFAVKVVGDLVGHEAVEAVDEARPGDVIMLENTRFESGETANAPELATALGGLADLFVLDAFGTAHRAHASTAGVAERIRSAAGPLLVDELNALNALLDHPPRPFTVVLGGAKVSDKLPVVNALLPIVDSMLVGGGMCFSLLAAEGYEIGSSLIERDQIDVLKDILASEYGDRLALPVDLVVADRFAEDAATRTVDVDDVDHDWMGLDIGPETAAQFEAAIRGSASVFWNGPMGVFEWPAFRAGTAAVAEAVTNTSAFTVVGGGDSVAALRLLGLEDSLSHVSTGGGAGLELLEGKALPGVAALERWVS